MNIFKRKEPHITMYTRIVTIAAIALLGLSPLASSPVWANDHEPAANAVPAPAPAADAEKPADTAPAPAEEKKDGEDKDGDGKPDTPAPAPAPEGTTE
jgi:hypothetical protein